LAQKDFKAVVTIVPKDPDAIKKLKQCEKDIREDAFAKAIESEVQEEVVFDPETIIVEESYNGPRLDQSFNPNPFPDPENKGMAPEPVLTQEFVMQTFEYFRQEKLLHRKYVVQILLAAIKLFSSLDSLLSLNLPRSSSGEDSEITGTFTVCGDTHGQFYDLANIFALGGFPSATNFYVFNGDFVDRGSFSFETVFSLICWKLAFPQSLHMLRGNHETKNMNKIYGFIGEIKHKYDDKVMGLFSKLFQALPLAAVIEKKVFVVHGGLSTQEGGVALEEIRKIPRFREPPESGLMSDLLWSGKRILLLSFYKLFHHCFLCLIIVFFRPSTTERSSPFQKRTRVFLRTRLHGGLSSPEQLATGRSIS
jgi:serine/threonine-protein phosphatase 5